MSKLRQLQTEGRLETPATPRPQRLASSLAKPDPGKRTFEKPDRPDLDPVVMEAAEHFLERSKAAGTLQTGSAFALHRVFLDRVEVSQLRRLVNHHNGMRMWPDVLVTLVDLYWDTEANPRNEWAWKHFVSSKTFEGLLAYLLGRIEQAYSDRADTRTPEQRREDTEAYWDRIAARAQQFTSSRTDLKPAPKPESERRTDEDVFEDDLEEWEAVMAKRAERRRSKEGS